MRVVVTSEQRYSRTPDGRVWTRSAMPYSFWKRYLAVFDEVRVVVRAENVLRPEDGWQRVDGDGVQVHPLPHYVGPYQFLLQGHRLRAALRSALQPGDAAILRVPSSIAATFLPQLLQMRYPFGLEVVGDPYDVFARGGVKTILRPLLRWLSPRQLRAQCIQASGVAYVTERALQERYPVRQGAFTTHYSSIELPPEAFVAAPRSGTALGGRFRIVTVGSLEQLYKAPDVLLNAVHLCVARGLDLELTFVGDGKYRPYLESYAQRLGLGERVTFLGQIPAGQAVRQQYDAADLFVLPSRTEGLPRAMIEAMARGLPCIGTRVGGIPELLSPDYLVEPGDPSGLARKIEEVALSPVLRASMSAVGLERASNYGESILAARRMAFYSFMRDATHQLQVKNN